MTVFGSYSAYYNLLYSDKNYAAEVRYVHDLIRKHCPYSKTVLNLGCGTGKHDFLLADEGYSVTGVDMSDEMLAVARSQLPTFTTQPSDLSPDHNCSTLNFLQGDVRTVRLNKQFDVVISLFHVMSYQTTNDDLKAAFETARTHLKDDGVFIFDCWYGPAVLTDRPAVRVKTLEDGDIQVTRIAEPVMHPNEHVVDVNYHIFIKDKQQGRYNELKETHRMRYLFKPEIELIMMAESMELIHCEEWLTGKSPGFDTWGVCFICRKS